jgi:RNA polymerase sigma-70 factor (ECF subfamily)
VDRVQRLELQRQLTRLAEGDRDAFHPVFNLLWPVLSALAGRALPALDADDAAQEALVKVFRRAAEFDPTRDALAWALGVAAWEVRTFRRRRQRRREMPAPVRAEPSDPAPSAEEILLAAEMREALAVALGTLSPLDAAALNAYAGGADRPDVSAATFRKRVQRALGRLREVWRSRHGL